MGDTTTEVDLSPYAEDIAEADPVSLEIRVPLIRHPHPRWYYVTAVVVNAELWVGLKPTEEELRIIGSFHEEYMSHWYGPPHTGWRARDMDKRPFDIDGGAVGRYLIKHKHGGWGYRKHTWQYGPEFVPAWNEEPVDLIAALDRCHSWGDGPDARWVQWKTDHPDIFGGGSDDR